VTAETRTPFSESSEFVVVFCIATLDFDVTAIADTVGGKVAAKLIAKVKQSGSFGYTAVLPENGAAQNPTTRELARPLDTIRQ
jgi:hypothetical protein